MILDVRTGGILGGVWQVSRLWCWRCKVGSGKVTMVEPVTTHGFRMSLQHQQQLSGSMDLPSTPSQRTLSHKDSQATLISLMQLDPSPIESPAPEPADDEKAEEPRATTSAPGLSSHGTMFYRALS